MYNFLNSAFSNILFASNVSYQTNLIVGSFNGSFVNFMLLTLLTFSLVLTFHSKGTTVHKVLGLLLVSIFVVFIWILQTQFLFIYIVYVLAFISAVLMLFLSVVLMLPISTLTAKNTSQNSSSFLLFVLYNDTCSFLLSSGFILSFSCIFIGYVAFKIISTSKNYNFNLVKWSSKYDLKMFLNLNKTNYLNSILLFKNLIYIIKNNLGKIYGLIRYFLILCFYTMFENSFKTINTIVKTATDVSIQSFLFLSVLFNFVFMFLNKQTLLYLNAAEMHLETSQGIGQLKNLLYGEFSLFLLFSTVVLLVALLGAAVMTRSKR